MATACRRALSVVLVIFGIAATVAGADHRGSQEEPDANATTARDAPWSQTIDRRLRESWQAAGVQPAPLADDATFLRRVYLDLVGQIPPASRVREFLADPSPDKRERLVDELLEGPGYVRHFSHVWSELLLPEAQGDFQVRYIGLEFEAWLRGQLAENVAYDQMVRNILTVPLAYRGNNSPYAFMSGAREPTPTAFFAAKEIRPENLAAATSRIFLGVRVDCAQCHDHPEADWTQEQFWSFAAFYGGIQRSNNVGNPLEALTELLRFGQDDAWDIAIPDSDKRATARFLDGEEPAADDRSPRDTLAEWITESGNPYFARAAVNRLWAQLMGRGIVEPVDDLDRWQEARQAALLDDLAQAFAADGYNLRRLIRAIVLSDAYQRDSRQTHESQADPEWFARRPVRGMTADQLYDSLRMASGSQPGGSTEEPFADLNDAPRFEFRALFQQAGASAATQDMSVLQSLTLMNGDLIQHATHVGQGSTLSAAAEMPLLSVEDRIDILFLASLGRFPRPDEQERYVEYVQNGGARGDFDEALADLFWVLLNSHEFGMIP